jgi:STE24 endopeptidase
MKTNLLFWIILAANVGMYLLDTLANRLNLRALKPELPAQFEGIYDREKYRRFLAYTAATANFERVEATWELALLLGFWLLGGYDLLDRAVRSLHAGFIVTGLLYLGALYFGNWLLGLPLEIYETFRIEERFGFNRTTPATFAGDQAKSVLLTAILGGGVLAIVLAILQHGGNAAWLYAWAVAAALLIVMVYAAPALILPLFNKMTPLEDGELRREIMACAERLGFPLAEISVMDGSRRSTKANAFFTGIGGTKRVVLFDTLVKNHTTEELVAVLAHEIGHYKLRHIIQHIAAAILNIGVFLFLAQWLIGWPGLYQAFGVRQPSIYAGLALFLVLYGPLSRLLGIVRGAQSRRHEFDADRFAAESTGLAHALGDALKKLSRNNFGNLSPHPLHVVLYHSHPPVLERVRALEAMQAPPGRA